MIKREYFTFGGVNSLDFGIKLVNPHTESSPERELEMVPVPGRNGDIAIDYGSWGNIQMRYELAIANKFMEQFTSFKAKMLSKRGYQRLQNSFEPQYYRLALIQEKIECETTPFHKGGVFTIVFDCKPQRFLLSGEEPVVFNAPGVMVNPTAFPSQPHIYVWAEAGEGEVAIGSRPMQINGPAREMVIDCESMTAYDANGSRNRDVYCIEFPVLEPGENVITFSGSVKAVGVIPRWWEL